MRVQFQSKRLSRKKGPTVQFLGIKCLYFCTYARR